MTTPVTSAGAYSATPTTPTTTAAMPARKLGRRITRRSAGKRIAAPTAVATICIRMPKVSMPGPV